MTRLQRNVTLAAVIIPFLAFIAAIVLLWNSLVSWTDIAILVVMYVPTALGITVGYHRLFTHRAFQAKKWVRYLFAVLGSMAVEGSVIDWVADHRKHHAFADDEGDPHSPHGHGPGLRGTLKGLWYAHMGWLFETQGQATKRQYAPDLLEDPGMMRINRLFIPIVLLGLAIPFGLGFALTGTLSGALTGFLWGGLVRIFLIHHVTWSINSVCHFYGRRRFETDDQSTNVFWLAIPSLGESWHHNHHAFPRAAVQGMRWYEIDISAGVIWLLEKLGLAWNVVRISPERQAQRLAGSGKAPRRARVAEQPAK
ncbi:MAG TPA: acyl-CoA desaturase [Solirubrobacterales bacterium]|jgi:stearoyl-CoA desaturase (delta-9 desaturase)